MEYNKEASFITTLLKRKLSRGREINIYGKALVVNEDDEDEEMKDITIEQLNKFIDLSKTQSK